ncbi:MAG: SRPBCC family protein [Gloeobacteraceae cyanobacterium ES-bin-316]|nr:SRPBCC family protein [Ferruginibacter sp.]
MAEIFITTQINCAIEIVFDLSRSIDIHLISTSKTGEKAIAGKTTGLIGLHEEVTWQARHLFKTRLFTSRITAMQSPVYFRDEMQKGDFQNFMHEHFFESNEEGTLMKDRIILQSPFGLLGRVADAVFLKEYIKKFLIERNRTLKNYAENGNWKQILINND